MTRTAFYLNYVKFRYNLATKDSALSAFKTSTIDRFEITECLFDSNRAAINTLSFLEADGDISDSVFVNNYGASSTDNIFISSSSMNITKSLFKMDVKTDKNSVAMIK